MKKISIIGAFGEGFDLVNGQTVKTKIIADELDKNYGRQRIWRIDTFGKLNNVISVLKSVWALIISENLIMLPAHNALKILAPWLVLCNTIFHRKLHYIVIGGWLDGYLAQHSLVEKTLHKFHGIYVETQTMKNALQKRGFSNVIILPNCKNLKILREQDLVYSYTEPFCLVTFSRVMQQKGIEYVARIVSEINAEAGRCVFKLDIYGQVDTKEIEWFSTFSDKYRLMEDNSTIRYKGYTPFYKSVEILSKYFALLFPTCFYTEGVPGTIIDAFAAGLPVISARWENFTDVVDDGVNGIGFEFENWNELKTLLINIAKKPEIINSKKCSCLKHAKDFLPSEVISNLSLGGKLIVSTFSRVMREKGIEDAILAVNKANSIIGSNVFKLIIYGQVEALQIKWFEYLDKKYALSDLENITFYGGLVQFDKSIDVLKHSFALLFPTYYAGEGFAGTIIDAYAAGIPVIASDWKYNAEVVNDGLTGRIFPVHDIDAMSNILVWAYQHQRKWNEMKLHCIKEAYIYQPPSVLTKLYEQI